MLLALLGIAAFPTGGVAQSSPLGLAVTDGFRTEWHGNNRNGEDDDDNYGAILNRFVLSATSGDLTAQAEVDSFYFIDPPSDAFQDDTVLERLTARLYVGDWHLIAGDYYLQFGRGIIVSLRREAEVGRDIALTGGQVQYALDAHRLTVLAGLTNPVNIDTVTEHAVADADDTMAGLSYRFSGLAGTSLEVFGLYLEPRERLLEDRDFTVSGGLSVELASVVDWMALYVEADAQERQLAGTSEQGYAAYLDADFYVGDVTFLLEGLLLDEFEQLGSRNTATGLRFRYNQPPTLERIQEEVLNNRDVVGARLLIEYYLLPVGLTIYANGTARLNNPGKDSEILSLHGYGGLELLYQGGSSRLELSGGYRDESQDDLQVQSMIHGEVQWVQSLTTFVSLNVTSFTEYRTLLEDHYYRGDLLVGLDWAPRVSVTFDFGYDTQDPSPDVANFFYAGILATRATDWLDLRLTGGTQLGGLRCVSGVCREFPAFAGVRLDAVGRF